MKRVLFYILGGGGQRGDLILSWISSSHSLLFPQTDYRALKAPSAETDWLMGVLSVVCRGGGVWWQWGITNKGRLDLLCVCVCVCLFCVCVYVCVRESL